MNAARFPPHAIRARWLIPTLSIILCALYGCTESLPKTEDFAGIETREQLEQRFGPPLRRQEMVRHNAFILGPVEDFWQRMKDGDRVEIVAYAVEGGTLEFYFLNGSTEIGGRAFAPAGAVY